MAEFSLRGKLSLADNALLPAIRVFDYVSPDRTRAWRVKEAHVWPLTVREDTGSDEGKILQQFTLYTDDGADTKWNHINDPTENRGFAWAMWAGYVRNNGSDDFITPENDAFAKFLVDPDTVVVKELWISCASTTESANAPVRDWGYMIVLEEIKVTPAQSVFQQIKGMAQNVT